MIKEQFIHEVVKRDIRVIYETQESVINNVLTTRTGKLKEHISKRAIDMQGAGLRPTYYMNVLTYLRFLDIQYRDRATRRQLALYNRVIWGVLYHETLPDLKYGLTEDIRTRIREELESMDYQNNHV